jgi:hypothetical protein
VKLLLLAALWAPATQVEPLWNFRWRGETHDTLSGNPALDPHYGFSNLRLRFGADLKWRRLTLHGVGQAAGALGLPQQGAFGFGRVYFMSSGGRDTSPTHLDLAELSLTAKPSPAWTLTGGRIGLRDGAETLTGDGRLDWLKQARLSERLLGTWDWVNVGRRFDGGSVSFDRPSWHLQGFAARMLQGGVDYRNAYRQLDGVDVAGGVVTVKRNALIPKSELRLYNIYYRDGRPSTRGALGGSLRVDAVGASLVGVYDLGSGVADLVLWSAYELGSYGRLDHRAAAWVAEGGYGWPGRRFAPWIRGGFARASGDRNPEDGVHRTFFNMAPTNHKFYGTADLVAFQNLANYYGEIRLEPHRKLKLGVEAHLFRLSEPADAWYQGSGPANNDTFGYVALRPGASGARSGEVGAEIDLTAVLAAHQKLALELGVSRFQGGALARRIFPVRDDFTWVYFQAVVSR